MKEAHQELRTTIKEEFGNGLTAAVACEMSEKVNHQAFEEICTEENIDKFVHALFDAADKDGSKTISFDEFERFIHQHASVAPSKRLGMTLVSGDDLIEANDAIESGMN